MAKLDKAINEGEKIIASAENKFANALKIIEAKVLREVNGLFNVVDVSGGKLNSNPSTIDFINSLDGRIKKALNNAGYNVAVNDLLKTFESVKTNNIKIQYLANGINIAPSQLNDLTRIEVQNTIDKLLGSGISRDFIIPIRESIYRNVILGSNVQDAQQTIRNYIITEDGKDSKLLRYAGQVAEDSINQYAGTIQQKIGSVLGLPDYIYAGSIILDSRCQCIYWVEKIKLDHIELIDEIETALSGGSLGGCRCSGMIPGTTLENFAINRGGYRCRHKAIPTKL